MTPVVQTPATSTTVSVLPMWKVKPVAAKAEAFENGGILLILYGRSTCTNCKTVYNALQTESFKNFCKEHGITVTYYLQDATGNSYRFPADYPEITTPSVLICKPLNGSGNTFAPGKDVELLKLIRSTEIYLKNTEARLEEAIEKIL